MRSTFTVVLLSLAAFAPGCSSSPPQQGPMALEGLFVTDSAGPIKQFNFVDSSHVEVMWAACGDGEPCVTSDTYAVNDAETAITLTEPGGKQNVVSLSGIIADTSPADASLTDEALRTLGLTGSGTPLVSGNGSLSQPSGAPVGSFQSQLASSGCTQLFKKSGSLFPNDQIAFDFFRSKGLSAEVSAGIVGNLDQESGNNAGSVQPGGPGRGIAQWSAGGRWDHDANDNATAFASQQHQNVGSLQLQLQFIWFELTTFPKYGLAQLKSASSPTAAADTFASKFEACGKCLQNKRDQFAQNAFASFGKDSADGGAGSCAGTGSPSGSDVNGSTNDGTTGAPSSSPGGTTGSPGGTTGSPSSGTLGAPVVNIPVSKGSPPPTTSTFFGPCATDAGATGACLGNHVCAFFHGKPFSDLCAGPDDVICCVQKKD